MVISIGAHAVGNVKSMGCINYKMTTLGTLHTYPLSPSRRIERVDVKYLQFRIVHRGLCNK